MQTTKEVAARLGVGLNIVTQMAGAGILRGKKHGRSWAFELKDVDRFCKVNGLEPKEGTTHG